MKVLFAFTHSYFWAPLDGLARDLCGRGHEVRLLLDREMDEKFGSKHEFDFSGAPYPVGWMQARDDRWRRPLGAVRELVSYSAYLAVRRPAPAALAERWRGFLPARLAALAGGRAGRALLSRKGVWRALRLVEKIAPADRGIAGELRAWRPDVVVAGSTIMPHSREVEYVKAARRLGIPTAVVIPSWDNLTTKGTIHVLPDVVLVWNRRMAGEAVRLHGVPPGRVCCTGAPRYDPWFAMRPSADRRAFCRAAGLDPARPFVVYLCSSSFIAEDEAAFVRRFVEALRGAAPQVLVRPHPLNLCVWQGFSARAPGVVVWPTAMPMNPAKINQQMYDTLFHGAAAVGVNTSAFIEAAVVDRPCVALVTEEHAATQRDIPHFRHLLDAGFLETPQTFDEAAATIDRLLADQDDRAGRRRQFVRDFVRPAGLDVPAATVLRDAIEGLGGRAA